MYDSCRRFISFIQAHSTHLADVQFMWILHYLVTQNRSLILLQLLSLRIIIESPVLISDFYSFGFFRPPWIETGLLLLYNPAGTTEMVCSFSSFYFIICSIIYNFSSFFSKRYIIFFVYFLFAKFYWTYLIIHYWSSL